MKKRTPAVYIMTNKPYGTLYVGVTSCLIQRVWQHRHKEIEDFTSRSDLDKLVWYEVHETMESAIPKEKAIKYWKREWKVKRIEALNSDWKDLYPYIL
ncbi:MAG: GIY-YIG nuclease family protein [Gammaproteobacteria bacterium]|nr:GIY-YIG nuclease family protein [Gammaproteobacteria bacterium]